MLHTLWVMVYIYDPLAYGAWGMGLWLDQYALPGGCNS